MARFSRAIQEFLATTEKQSRGSPDKPGHDELNAISIARLIEASPAENPMFRPQPFTAIVAGL
jgi:hypothetical protein